MVCGSRPMSVPVFAANFARLTEQAVPDVVVSVALAPRGSCVMG